jgi:hypothetical protein
VSRRNNNVVPSREPLRVVGELADRVEHPNDKVQAMRQTSMR